jgi:thioredoxin-related protein
MKKILLPVALLFSTAVCAQQVRQSLEIGKPVPMADVTLKSTGKKDMTLQQAMTAKGLLVMFSCNTCPYVIKSQARTTEMMEYAKQKGIGMVVINSNEAQRDEEDSYKAMAKYAKEQDYSAPYLVDESSKLADAFGASRTPEVFLFDASGNLIYKGAMEDNPTNPSESKQLFLKSAIDNMLSGAPVDPNSTKSIGCTIKRKQA